MGARIKSFLIVLIITSLVCLNVSWGVYGASVAVGSTAMVGGATASGGMVAGAAALSAVLPVVLVALGVGSIAYAISKSDDFEKEVDDCGDYVMRNGGKVFKNIGKLLGPSIQINYYDNRTYIDELTLKLIARWAIEKGYFNSGFVYEDLVSGNQITISSLCSLKEFFDYLGVSDMYKYFNDLADYNLFNVRATYSKYGNLDRYSSFSVTYSKVNLPRTFNVIYGDSILYNDSGISYSGRTRSLNYNSSTNDYDSNDGSSGSKYFWFPVLFRTNDMTNGYQLLYGGSNVGIVSSGSGSSVSSNIPTISDDNVDLPKWVNHFYTVSDNNYYTITMPDNYQIPVMAPIDYDFNDLPVNISIPDFQWDPPYQEGDQNFFQDGDYYFYPIVDNPIGDVSVISENFLAPASILEKFPFCVPSDMVKVSRIFLSASGPSAPKYEQVINFAGTDIDTSIDLSRFDGVASVARKMEYILFLGGLMYVSIWLFKR